VRSRGNNRTGSIWGGGGDVRLLYFVLVNRCNLRKFLILLTCPLGDIYNPGLLFEGFISGDESKKYFGQEFYFILKYCEGEVGVEKDRIELS
jgi:hypothetical protein